MNGFEHIRDTIDDTLTAQLNTLDLLEDPYVSPADLHELLESARRSEHLANLTSITLIRELTRCQAFHPNSRQSFNHMLHRYRFSRAELKDAVRLADDLFDKPASVDAPEGKPAVMPNVARGLASAQFGVASAMIIAKVLDEVPFDTPAETIAWVEKAMSDFACTLSPDDLRKAGHKILQGLNAESEPKDGERQRRRSANLSNQGADLMSSLSAKATPELDALLRRLFADYAGPGDLLPEGDKESDTRTAGQRRHDALVAALKNALHPKGPMPPTRGCSTVVASMSIEQLAAAAGVVPTDVGTLLPVKDLLRLGADKNAFLALLEEGTGNLIELGKFKRAADLYAYLGLVASQGGDMTPGSDLAAAMCEIHHINAWRNGGLSTPDNLMFVGHRTHRNIDDNHKNPNKWWTMCTKTGHMVWREPESFDPDRPLVANFNPATWFTPGQMMKFGMGRAAGNCGASGACGGGQRVGARV